MMNQVKRAVASMAMLAVLVPAFPTAAGAGDLVIAAAEETTTTTTAPAEGGVTPVVEAPTEAPDEEEQPWTARFLAPTVLILGLLGLVAAIAYYLVRIRGRYRVVGN